ncbi:MAG: type II secretion system F family protein [Phycisphaeraceae bacterium]
MPRFLYQARDGKGEMATGVVNALDPDAAAQVLRAEGKFIVKLRQVAEESEESPELSVNQHARGVKRTDVVFFTHQMSVMIETGVPISEALECIGEQSANPHFKEVVRHIADHVQAGGELSVALKRFPRTFPAIMVSLIRASEVSGTMGQMLERISHYLDKEERTRRQVKGAMMYPAFMMFAAVTVTVFLMVFVLPRFAAIYQTRQATLPGPTRLLLGISHSLVHQWYLWVAVTVALIVAVLIVRGTQGGQRCLDWLKLHTPVVRHLFTNLYTSRACRTMGTMIAAGVSMLDTIAIVRSVTVNMYYADLWDQVDDSLRQGMQLSDPLFASPLIPRAIAQMIRSGERSGRLGQVMNRVAEHTENEFDESVKNTTKFIEPVMVMFMGALVGFVAISLLLPIFSVSTVVAGK